MRNLKQLFGICEHEYEIIERADIVGNSSGKKIGFIIISKCKKCGKLKSKEF